MRSTLIATAATLGLSLGLAAPASADPIKLNMPSAFPGDLVQLGQSGLRFQDTVNAISGGEVEVRFFEPGALVPAHGIFEAVASGAVDAGWSMPGHWAAENSALPLFSAVPFGPPPGEYLAWMWFGGGEEMMNAIYQMHGLHALICGLSAPEASGWFRDEIRTLGDLDGLEMRFYGLGARVIEKLGVKTRVLAAGEIQPALEAGTIDATEFSMPAIDRGLGFDAVAGHYYFPGWHQQWALQELLINKAKWDSFSETQKTIVRTACQAGVAWQLAEGEAIQAEALAEIEGRGTAIHVWPEAILDALRRAWDEVAAEESAANPDFAEVWGSLSAFREGHARWRELGYLK